MAATVSGSEVTRASKVVPTNPAPRPVISAISLLERTREGVTTTSTPVAAAKPSPARHRGMAGWPAGSSTAVLDAWPFSWIRRMPPI